MSPREIDARTAASELSSHPQAMYVDVRTPAEFEQGHPEGAWNLPVALPGMLGMRMNPEFLAVATKVLPRDARLIVGCKSGQRSAMACQVLAQAGWTDLANVSGGFHGGAGPQGPVPGWAQCDLPTSARPTPGRSWEELKSRP